MGFSDEDLTLMKNLYAFEDGVAKELITEFLNKGYGLWGLNELLKKL